MQQPRTIVFMAAIMLSGAEFTLGPSLMLGVPASCADAAHSHHGRDASAHSLHLYLQSGERLRMLWRFLVNSNGRHFLKNVVITAVLIFLIKNNRKAAPLFTHISNGSSSPLLVAFLLSVGLYGYNIQPMIDFRSFPVGSALLHDDDTDGESSDEGDVTFLYEKMATKRVCTRRPSPTPPGLS